MKKYVKRNQILITALAIMIAVAGYLSFQDKSKEEAVDVASVENTEGYLLDLSEEELAYMGYLDETTSVDLSMEDLDQEEIAAIEEGAEVETEEIASLDSDSEAVAAANFLEGDMNLIDEDTAENLEPGEAVFTSANAVSTLSGAKLIKEQTRAKNKETLLDIINNTGITEEAKADAIKQMVESTAIAEKEMGAEILLEAKGFDGAVVSMTGDTCDVCVVAEKLTEAQRAQIEDIVSRKTEVCSEKIVITSVW